MNEHIAAYRVQIIAIVCSIALIIFIIESVRRGRLREKYSLIWLFAGVVMLVFSIWRDLLDTIAQLIGVAYAPSVLFLTAMFFGILLLIHFSITISSLTDTVKTLTQEIGLLRNELEERTKKTGSV